LGIAYVGNVPAQTRVMVELASSAAPGGADGSGSVTGTGAGTAGIVDQERQF
jgi:hypothetical protein